MKLGDISWTDFERKNPSLALIPTGSTEQHGPHGPIATDTIIAKAIAARTAEETGTVLLPAINVGISREHGKFPGSLYLPPDVFRDQLRETIISANNSGMDKFVVVNGHGGNVASIKEVCKALYHDHGVKAMEWTWFNAISSESMGHAGKLETSFIMYLREDLIKNSREKGASSWGKTIHGSRIDYDAKLFTENGVVGDPTQATKEKGKKLFKKSTNKLTELILEFKNSDETLFNVEEL